MKNRLIYYFRLILNFFKRQFRNPRKRLLLEATAVILIAGIVFFMLLLNKKTPDNSYKEGVEYIKALEKSDTSSVEQEIKELKKAERKEALENGETDVWQQFNDSAILGDSRAVGFSYHGFVEDNRVIAEGGATIRDIPNYFDKLKNLNPSTVFLCFGLNDISIGYWDTSKEYIKELDEVVRQLQKNLPAAEIYVNSTIPAIPPAFERSEKWRNIPDWNKDVKAHCEENGIFYIDISETVEKYSEYYDADGIHMNKEFYPYWGIDMITEVSENE